MRDETYEGFANWDTWLVALTFDNNKNLYDLLNQWKENQVVTVETVQQFVKKALPHGIKKVLSYNKVNWTDLVEHWLEND